MTRITPQIDGDTASAGTSVHLVGAPGIGKTRLAIELLGYAALLGYRTLTHRAQSSSHGLPLATIVQLIRQVSELPGAAAVSTEAWTLASRLLVEGGTAETASGGEGAPVSPSRLSWLLASLVESVAHESRLIILVDDLHNWDAASEAILSEVIRLTGACRCFWLSTSRRQPRAHDGEREGLLPGTTYRLPPLSSEASRELAELLMSGRGRSDSIARAHGAALASGGNPLFIRELLAGSEPLSSRQVPTSLSRIIEERLCSLPTASQRLLRVVRLLGPHATIPVVARVVHSDRSVPTSEIENLEHESILTISSGGVLTIHECWHSLVDSQMTSAAKASLAYECAVALRSHLSGRNTAFSAMYLGELFLAGGSELDASEHLQFAAEQFASLGLATHATRAYEKVVESSGLTNPDLALLVRYAKSSHSCGYYAKCFDVIERILCAPRSAALLPDDDRARLLALRVDCVWRLGGDARHAIDELLSEIARDAAGDAAVQEACFWGLRCVLVHSKSSAEVVFRDSSARAAKRSGQSLFGALVAMIFAAERGRHEDIIVAAERVTNRISSISSPLEIVLATRLTGTALRYANEHDQAERLLESSIRTALEHELISEAQFAAYSATYGALDTDRLDDARRWIDLADGWKDSHDSHISLSSRDHALSRLFAQQGRFRESLAVFEDRLDEIERDPLRLRGCIKASCIHWAASECGEKELALRLLTSTKATFAGEAPSMQLDFVAECRVRTLKALGMHDDAMEEAKSYLARMNGRAAHKFASFYRELESARTVHSAAADLRGS